MATYAIGDIQGCFEPFQRLLEIIQFDPQQDTLWLTGDLVNRGPASLEVLRYVSKLPAHHQVVLGNHDLHLLAVSVGARALQNGDTLETVLQAPDKDELLRWLRQQPMLVQHDSMPYVMTHAGIAPCWTIPQAATLAAELEAVLRGEQWQSFFSEMYGNTPDHWDDSLQGVDRLRCIVNYLTRMRFCHADGRMNLTNKGTVENADDDCLPWFKVSPDLRGDMHVIFGHWAALRGETGVANIHALDTGCVWGSQLTAMRLEDGERFSTSCSIVAP